MREQSHSGMRDGQALSNSRSILWARHKDISILYATIDVFDTLDVGLYFRAIAYLIAESRIASIR